jgi:integrase
LEQNQRQAHRAIDAVSEIAILTAARTSEGLGATWGEVDLAHDLWTVPADRIKAGREHRVPLSGAALNILHDMAKLRETDDGKALVFPSRQCGTALFNMALLAVLKRMQRGDLTAHGFRSTFRDWCAEQTNYPREVAEAALAHISGDKVELAYRRGDLFEKRRQLMDGWARYCFAPCRKDSADKVVAIHRTQATG